MEREIGGVANATGFRIYNLSGIKVRTKGYEEPIETLAEIKKWIWILIFALIILIIFVAGAWVGIFYVLGVMDLGFSLIERIVLSTLLPMVVLAMVLCIFIHLSSGKGQEEYLIHLQKCYPEIWRAKAEYHTCEHKLIYLLENNLEVNLENLRLAPSFISNCGSGENQALTLAEPSLEELTETIKVGQEYLLKKTKQSP